MTTLAGKVAIITGATSGIGACAARLFVASGACVVLAGRREEAGRRLVGELGDATSFVRTDVVVEADLEALIQHAFERFGRIDCLFNNAGAPSVTGDISTVQIEAFDDAMAVHVRGPLLGMKYVAPIMIAQGSGSIINTASINGLRAGMVGVGYSTAKAAVIHMSRCAAVELGEKGIRVNCISPGPVLTGIFGKAGGLSETAADENLSAARRAFEGMLPKWQPLPGVVTADDIAEAAVFLASDASRFINGHNLVVDGGITAGRPASIMREERRLFARAFRHD
jgi:NAD(P)-dependent dehydrogenase (short-subunit alcohol dehydrogenase family)